jgi:hypothetical protein
MDLSVPVELRGDAGAAVSRFLKDGVVPVRVTGQVGALRVLPDLRGLKVAEGAIEGLLEKGRGLFGR